jgi:putative drug exporter of the RND superfamily
MSRLGRLADLAYRRRGRVVLAWIATLAVVIAIAPRLAGDYDADFGTKGSESEAVSALLAKQFDGRSGETVTVAWEAAAGASSPGAQKRIDAFTARAERLPGIGSASPPRVSRDGTIAVADLQLDRRGWDVPPETGKELIRLSDEASGDGVKLAVGGNVIGNAEDGGSPEGIGLLAAAVILLVAFGSIVAAGLPLAVALFGLGISTSLIGVLAAVIDVPEFAPAVAGLIGIGVGVDYALLVLTRFRTGIEAGAAPRAAVIESIETAGRSVLVAGTTVLISVLGLFFMGVSYLRGVALATSMAVLVVMAASVTLLPALLAFAGPRVNRLRIPGLGRGKLSGDTPAARWSRMVQRRPAIALVVATVAVLALAAPMLGLRLGFPDAGNDRAGTPTRTTYDMVSRGFGPGANGPLILAAQDVPAGTLSALADRLRGVDGVAFVSPPQLDRTGHTAVLSVVPTTTPQAAETSDLVHRLRDEVPPQVLVGGSTAAFVDQSQLVAGRLPLFVAGVVGLSFLLLLCAFRSPLIALKAGAMNLLSVGAAYGVISLFAQGGWAGQLIGIDTPTPVAPFIPVMMFAILFGLSMDYEVFLLSRVREEYLRHGDTTRAVADGLAKTARVITAAAAIMIAVFLAFVTAPEVFLKLLGVGMATAILVDATIVRMLLVPALMQLIGRANWWIPAWLDRALPRLSPEAPPARRAEAAAAAGR